MKENVMDNDKVIEGIIQDLGNRLYLKFVKDNEELLNKLIHGGFPIIIDSDLNLVDTRDMYKTADEIQWDSEPSPEVIEDIKKYTGMVEELKKKYEPKDDEGECHERSHNNK
jgi:hypothetical protein